MAQTPVHRPWTLMVYMAGDNGKVFDSKNGKMKLMPEMASAGYHDLAKMGAIGTTRNVAVCCLFDTPAATYSIEVRRGNGFADSVVKAVPPVNTGDPAILRQFIVQTVAGYPADHYALVIWNHGMGWLDTDVYAPLRSADLTSPRRAPIFRSASGQPPGGEATRPIAFDDSSMDFLDAADLRQALGDARSSTGVRLDLIGMDACLMASVEGARELAPFADFFVASQEVEPMSGWPYGEILSALDGQPGLSPAAAAVTIVRQYARSYHDGPADETVTQSAIALANTERTERLCGALVSGILEARNAELRALVQSARDRSLGFQDRVSRDLGDFARQLVGRLQRESYPTVSAAAAELCEHMNGRRPADPVLQVGFVSAYISATGMSAYLPKSLPFNQRKPVLDIYRQLEFAKATGWDQFVDWLLSDF